MSLPAGHLPVLGDVVPAEKTPFDPLPHPPVLIREAEHHTRVGLRGSRWIIDLAV